MCSCSRYSFSQAVRERDCYVLRLYVIFRLCSQRERERERDFEIFDIYIYSKDSLCVVVVDIRSVRQ